MMMERIVKMDYSQYHNLDSYVFDVVRTRFSEQGCLYAFDFFCIVIWKANRAKSKVAKRLLEKSKPDDLEATIHKLTAGLYQQTTAKEKMRYLWEEWGFRLPMASAILAILYPDEFAFYDVRVCDILEKYHELVNYSKFERVWQGYEEFKREVEGIAEGVTLRDKDRYLWGKSFYKQLVDDIQKGFPSQSERKDEQEIFRV